ncbi:MAG TPA: alpha/beta hydrolase [Deferrisomatales bacterium]|nr:alpha/beta hydrolase [Deferrisomatales bacterium]
MYWPQQPAPALPVLVYYHGGGFVLCNLDTHDSVCRSLANRSGCLTVSVAYRLSPETKLPGAAEDAYAAAAWVAANAAELGGDPARLAVGGDSAGGTLAAAVALLARDRESPRIAFQLLVYPATDAGRTPDRYPSYRDLSEGYFLTRQMMDWFATQQTDTGTDLFDPRISPLGADHHRDLPPAFVLTAGFDPLRDEGKAYADALAGAGVPVTYSCYETTIHGFLSMGRFLPAALEALDECAGRLRSGLAATRAGSVP